jgi:uncharacterized protein
LARGIGLEEGADLRIVQAAALLHDVGRSAERQSGVCHAREGARRARIILQGHPPEDVERVAQAIMEHRFRGGLAPTSLEARVLRDADKLDAMGAIGVARAFAVAGAQGKRLHAPVPPGYDQRDPERSGGDQADEEHTPVHEYRFKLSRLSDGMLTAAGRRIAQGRHAFMEAFFQRLGAEVRGES